MYRINVDNFKYAPVSVNEAGTYTIGTLVPIPGLMAIDLGFMLASGELYGDGALASKLSKITGATLKVDLNKLPVADRAYLMGATVIDGIMDVKASDTPNFVACYFEIPQDDGNKEQLWLLVGQSDPSNITAKQSESNITFSTDSITINFKPRNLDKKVLRYADTSTNGFSEIISKMLETNPDASGTADLSSIAVKTAPAKTSYTNGDSFDARGLVITATMSDGSTVDVAYTGQEDFEFSPDPLTTGTTSVTISYEYKGVTETVTQAVTVVA